MLRSDPRELRNSKVKLGWVVVGGWWVYRAKTNTALAQMLRLRLRLS